MAFITLLSLGAILQLAVSVFIPNGAPRLNEAGEAIDMHDGSIVQWTEGGDYYWYGIGYGGCLMDTTKIECTGILDPIRSAPCGFQLNHTINIYRSSDLLTWTFQGEALPEVSRPLGIYYHPKVIYNAASQKYLLWVNRLPVISMDTSVVEMFEVAAYVVAESSSPTGPFTLVTTQADLPGVGLGLFDLLVEGDDGYIAYRPNSGTKAVSIVKLNSNFTGAALPVQSTGTITSPNGALAFFKYANHYYVTSGIICCFCYAGTGTHIYVSADPMGPWEDTGVEIAMSDGPTDASRVRAQLADVFPYASPNGTILIWAGDQWGLSSDGTKGHVFQYWVPMTWDDSAVPPVPQRLQVVTGFDTDAPFNLSPFRTGFCDSTEVDRLGQVLLQLAACTSPDCYQTTLRLLTPDCAQCIIATQDSARILEKCIPPDYQAQTGASPCSDADAAKAIQTLSACPDLHKCLDQVLEAFNTLTPPCINCLMRGHRTSFDLAFAATCFPSDFLGQLSGVSPAGTSLNPACVDCLSQEKPEECSAVDVENDQLGYPAFDVPHCDFNILLDALKAYRCQPVSGCNTVICEDTIPDGALNPVFSRCQATPSSVMGGDGQLPASSPMDVSPEM